MTEALAKKPKVVKAYSDEKGLLVHEVNPDKQSVKFSTGGTSNFHTLLELLTNAGVSEGSLEQIAEECPSILYTGVVKLESLMKHNKNYEKKHSEIMDTVTEGLKAVAERKKQQKTTAGKRKSFYNEDKENAQSKVA